MISNIYKSKKIICTSVSVMVQERTYKKSFFTSKGSQKMKACLVNRLTSWDVI